MSNAVLARLPRLDANKFHNPNTTASGEARATVTAIDLKVLWFNTGTLCNLTCANCYIESSPSNDRLAYLTLTEVDTFLDEIGREDLGIEEIGFTGGEPFMNPDIAAMLESCLDRGFRVLVLTNAMRPMMKLDEPLIELNRRFGSKLSIRVSLDHYSQTLHEMERGARTWQPTLDGLKWLAANGFDIHVAGRTYWGDGEDELRKGYARLFAEHGVPVDAFNPALLVLFPEMDVDVDVPEITEKCWDTLGVDPASVMCATSRMVVRRKGQSRPVVVPCTLLPYDPQFELGHTLAGADRVVRLNHPHCARFCVLGGASCSNG